MTSKLPVARNIRLLRVHNFLNWCWPLNAVAIIYFQQITGSWATASFVFSLYILVQALCAVPTGIISDKWSRSRTLVVSSLFFVAMGLCFAMAGVISSTPLLFAGAAIWGLAGAFETGTEEGLIYETMADLDRKDEYDIAYASTRAWRYIGALAAGFIAIPVIYFFDMLMLAWISIIPAVAQTVVSFMFVEPKSYRRSERRAFPHLLEALLAFVRNRKARRIALAHSMNFSWGEVQYRINTIFFAVFVPIWAVDLVYSIYRICSSAGFKVAMRLRGLGFFKMALVGHVYKISTVGVALVFNNIISPFIFAISSLGTGPEHTAESALMQEEFTDEQRATMRSIIAIFAGVLSAGVFAFSGWLAEAYSARTSLGVLVLYKAVIAAYFFYLMRKYR